MEKDKKVQVKQGRFVIESVCQLISGENFATWYVDTKSKYPDFAGYMGSTLLIWPGEGAQHLDESTTEETQIILPERYADWMFTVGTGRYEIYIAAWKMPDSDSWETVYDREEE